MSLEHKPARDDPLKPVAVLIYVHDVSRAMAWYASALPETRRHAVAEASVAALNVGGVILEFVAADEKVGCGKSGTVVYWSVPVLRQAISHFEDLGATLYRGPMAIEDGQGMCQLEDPFGNLIGLRGCYPDH